MHEQGCQSSLKSEQWESTLGLLREKGTLTIDELKTMKGLKLEPPANYRIRVQGHLADQAALTRVLNTLYELHLSLISVENLDDKSPN